MEDAAAVQRQILDAAQAQAERDLRRACFDGFVGEQTGYTISASGAMSRRPTLTVDDLLDAMRAIRDPDAVVRVRVAPGQAEVLARVLVSEFGPLLGTPPQGVTPAIERPGCTMLGVPIVEDAEFLPDGFAVMLDADGEVVKDGIIRFHPLPMLRLRSSPPLWPIEHGFRWAE